MKFVTDTISPDLGKLGENEALNVNADKEGKTNINYEYRQPESMADCIELCGSEDRVYQLIGQRNKQRIGQWFSAARLKLLKGDTAIEGLKKLIAEAQSSLKTGNLISTRGVGNTAAAKSWENLMETAKQLDKNASAEEKLAALRAAGIDI